MIKSNFLSAALAALIVFVSVQGWRNLVPVVAFMNMEIIGAERGMSVVGKVSGYKVLPCDVVKGSFVGWYKLDDTWYETPFEFIQDSTPDSTRVNGSFKQSFGLWKWEGIPEGASGIRLTLQHSCWEEIRTTTAGSWEF